MILFKKDWAKYPNAIVHVATSNHTFLKMAELFKGMGVENYYFHLALMQPELEHVDPHSKVLSEETMVKIGFECRYNPWYYFREVARVPPQAGNEPVQLRANRGNLALWWCFFAHMDIALIQPRQTGKSLSTDILMSYLLDIATTNTDISMLTKDDQLRVANVERLKEIRDLVPKYLSQKTKHDSDNKQEVTCNRLNNRYRTSVAQGSALAANNVGRGLTSPIMHIDEGPFCTHIDVTMPAMLASGSAARDEAAATGAAYGNIFTTTAGKKDTKAGKYMHAMISGGLPWSEHLYDSKDEADLYDIVDKGKTGKKVIVNATFSHRQLGKTDEWLVKVLKDVNATAEEADRDFFNIWTSGTSQSPLSIELNEAIKKSKMEPKHVEITRHNYTINWMIPRAEIESYMARNKVVIGMDTSEGIGRDFTTMVLVNAKTLEVVATGAFNETNLMLFGQFVADVMTKYDNTILIPERRSTGQTLIDTLLVVLPTRGIDPFKRIFNTVIDNRSERPEDYKEIIGTDPARRTQAWYDRWKKCFGYATAASGKYSRNALYSDVFQTAARKGGRVVRDAGLIDEITSLTVKNGRIDHSDGGHDDRVIAWLLAGWLLTMGRGLEYYGIEGALTETLDADKKVDPDEERYLLREKHRQEELREEMENILERVRGERNDFIVQRLEGRLRVLDSKLQDQFDENSSIDSLLKDAKESRSQRLRDSRRGNVKSFPRYNKPTSMRRAA